MTRIVVFILWCLLIGCSSPSEKPSIDYNNTIEEEDISVDSTLAVDNEPNILYMEEENGVRYVWIEINGVRLRFIFDTGASSICISSSEASVLVRQGTLSEEDIIGIEKFQDATGGISEGTQINLRDVKIGSMVLENVTATVIDNPDAPLLLGQSVLERFGKIEIDNDKKEIIFK